ncbi:MAG: RraA family protein [Rhizobiaceae bacterium]
MTIVASVTPVIDIRDDLLERWRKIPVAVVVDLDADIRQVDPLVRPVRKTVDQPALFGRIVTALCEPPDFGAALCALDVVEAGDVLVIAADGYPDCAMIGEILGGHLRSKGVGGLVVDGAIRDVKTLASWDDFSVYTRSVNPKGPASANSGRVNSPVKISGVEVMPGEVILGDDDGLVVLSREELVRWISPAESRLELEKEWISRLEQGEPARSVFSLEIESQE